MYIANFILAQVGISEVVIALDDYFKILIFFCFSLFKKKITKRAAEKKKENSPQSVRYCHDSPPSSGQHRTPLFGAGLCSGSSCLQHTQGPSTGAWMATSRPWTWVLAAHSLHEEALVSQFGGHLGDKQKNHNILEWAVDQCCSYASFSTVQYV